VQLESTRASSATQYLRDTLIVTMGIGRLVATEAILTFLKSLALFSRTRNISVREGSCAHETHHIIAAAVMLFSPDLVLAALFRLCRVAMMGVAGLMVWLKPTCPTTCSLCIGSSTGTYPYLFLLIGKPPP
jgi:uncharacterized membrane protein YadS